MHRIHRAFWVWLFRAFSLLLPTDHARR